MEGTNKQMREGRRWTGVRRRQRKASQEIKETVLGKKREENIFMSLRI